MFYASDKTIYHNDQHQIREANIVAYWEKHKTIVFFFYLYRLEICIKGTIFTKFLSKVELEFSEQRVYYTSFFFPTKKILPMTFKMIISCLLAIMICSWEAESHGILVEPVSRASAWRKDFKTPKNYNDHELYCGGITVSINFLKKNFNHTYSDSFFWFFRYSINRTKANADPAVTITSSPDQDPTRMEESTALASSFESEFTNKLKKIIKNKINIFSDDSNLETHQIQKRPEIWNPGRFVS